MIVWKVADGDVPVLVAGRVVVVDIPPLPFVADDGDAAVDVDSVVGKVHRPKVKTAIREDERDQTPVRKGRTNPSIVVSIATHLLLHSKPASHALGTVAAHVVTRRSSLTVNHFLHNRHAVSNSIRADTTDSNFSRHTSGHRLINLDSALRS